MLSNLCLQVGMWEGPAQNGFLYLFHSFKGEGIINSKAT